jgi:hypothetical protein
VKWGAERRGSADRMCLRIVPETLQSAVCSVLLVQLHATRDGDYKLVPRYQLDSAVTLVDSQHKLIN